MFWDAPDTPGVGMWWHGVVRSKVQRDRFDPLFNSPWAALPVITALLAEFGQGGSAAHRGHVYYYNSFLIADPREAWVLETAGRRWVARHLSAGVYAISNRPTIGTAFDANFYGISVD